MKITIEADTKEIAALLAQLREKNIDNEQITKRVLNSIDDTFPFLYTVKWQNK